MADDGDRIDEGAFASEAQLQAWCDRIGEAGLRGTGSAAHERTIAWIEDELRRIPGVRVRSDEFELRTWAPVPEGDLEHAAELRVGGVVVPVAGAVPYSLGVEQAGPLVVVPAGEAITAEIAAGAIVLRDFPHIPLPYDVLLDMAFHATPDAEALRGETWDRPGLADSILHADLLAAGEAGAAGILFAFDLPREQVAGYFEPHKGCHYALPAAYLGVDERELVRAAAAEGASAQLVVRATAEPGTTRNLYATLPGQTEERIVLVTHTDGNTWVQENGIAALLAMARWLAARPLADRRHTIELAFTSAHLHISREGGARYAEQLDAELDRGAVAFVFAIEHLGARDLAPVARTDGPGRRLRFSDDAEPVLWAVGPSEAMQAAVVAAVRGRDLERVLVNSGLGFPVEGQVPQIASFGGLGSYFHTHLVPTTSIITGPWSLWAPAFGADAVDVGLLRRQALAAADVVVALDRLDRDEIAGGYLDDRRARAAGAVTAVEAEPPEVAP